MKSHFYLMALVLVLAGYYAGTKGYLSGVISKVQGLV